MTGDAPAWPTIPTQFDKDDLLKCARGELFGPGNAQLPEPPMLMMDRITDISARWRHPRQRPCGGRIRHHPDLWFFDCHFPGNPIMPGCLGLDGLWQLTGFNLGWRGWQGRGMALGVGEVKLTGMVRPDRKMLTYYVDFTRAIDRRLTMGVADGRVVADGEEIYVVKDMKVGLATIRKAEGRTKGEPPMRRVVVTGLGIVSPIGNNAAEVLAALKAGKSGIEASPNMAEHGFRSQVAGTLKIDAAEHVDKRDAAVHGAGCGLCPYRDEPGDRRCRA